MEKITLAIIGAHGAGKTTIGRMIAKSFGCIFQTELGGQMRNEYLANNANAHAACPQQDFDDKVITAELARDAEWLSSDYKMRVVETWHPGNYAYAAQRQSQVDKFHLLGMHQALKNAIVLPLRIERTTAITRLRESSNEISTEEITDFFHTVSVTAESISQEWCPNILPPIQTDSNTPKETTAEVIALLNNHINLIQ